MVTLDDLDLQLLAALHANARLSNQDLSERVPLSASQCARRRQRLEEDYVITGYRVLLDPAALGLGIEAMVDVFAADYDAETANDFRRLIDRTAEIIDAWAMSGEVGYVLRVVTADMPALARLVSGTILTHPAAARARANIALETIKTAGLPPIAPGDTK